MKRININDIAKEWYNSPATENLEHGDFTSKRVLERFASYLSANYTIIPKEEVRKCADCKNSQFGACSYHAHHPPEVKPQIEPLPEGYFMKVPTDKINEIIAHLNK